MSKSEVMKKMWELIREDQVKYGKNYKFSKRVKLAAAWKIVKAKSNIKSGLVNIYSLPSWLVKKNYYNNTANNGVLTIKKETANAYMVTDAYGVDTWIAKKLIAA